MAAYETSTSTLRNILSHPSLNLDKVDTTMDNLASALADSKEIDDAVRIGGEIAVAAGGVAAGADDDELAHELAALVEEEKAAQAAREAERKEREKEAEDKAEAEIKAREEAQRKLEDEKKRRVNDREEEHQEPAKDWETIHTEAQSRKAEEAARSEMERLRKDETRVAAE